MDATTEALSRGRRAREAGDLTAAREFYVQAARLHREQGDLLAYAHDIRHIADMFLDEQNCIEARPLYEEALELYRSHLQTRLLDLANTVRPYALLLKTEGEMEKAKELWEEAKMLYRSLRIDAGVAECSSHLTDLHREAFR